MSAQTTLPCTLADIPELRDLMPFRSRLVPIGEYHMHVVDEGQGPAVLLLHGNPTWSFFFRSLIKELRTHFRVIAPDHLGCGLSSRTPGRRFRAVDRIEHLQAMLQTLGVDRFSIVMHDWGGAIGTGLAVRDPNRVEKMVYFNTTLTETESLPLMIKRAATPVIGKYLTYHSMDFLKLMMSFGASTSLPREIKQGYYLPYRTRAQRQAIWDFVCDIPFDQDHPSYPAMLEMASQIETLAHKPVQIVWGLRDPCFHRGMMDKVVVHFPDAALHEFANASHLVLEDEPSIPSLVSEFLKRPSNRVVRQPSPRAEGAILGGALYEAFREQALSRPYEESIITAVFLGDTPHYRRTSFSQLFGLVQQYERALESLGLVAGDRVVMLLKLGPDFLALAYAIIGRGAIPVFMDPGMGRENLVRAFEGAKAQGFIGVPKAHLLRFLCKETYRACRFRVVATDAPVWRCTTLWDLRRFSTTARAPVYRDERATELLAYTSGGTGTPKSVIFTSRMLNQQLRIFRESFGLTAGGRDLPLLPIFSLFGVALGVTAVIPPIDPAKPITFDPKRLVRMMEDQKVDTSFGSPTLWGKLAEYCIRSKVKLHSIARVFMAGAPVPRRIISLLQEVLPNGETYTPYGATEALPVTLLCGADLQRHTPEPSRNGGTGTYVGRPVQDLELCVARVQEDANGLPLSFTTCAVGEIGEVLVRGENVSPEYFGDGLATGRSKIAVPGGFWHRMGDLGYQGHDGGLFFCGRSTHAVHGSFGILCTDPIENIVNEHPMVRRSALISIGETHEPAVVVEPQPSLNVEREDLLEGLSHEVLERLAPHSFARPIKKVFFNAALPVDGRHNAKIFRDKLASWAVGKRAYPPQPTSPQQSELQCDT